MNTLNQNALFKLSYGLYVLTAREGDKDNGCIINVAPQLTDTPLQMLVSVNKQNYTHGMIARTGLFNVSILTEHTPLHIIQHFGFQSGKDVNKFENSLTDMRSSNGLRYVPRYTNAYLSGKVNQMVDLGTHTLFIAEVTESVLLNNDPSLTYEYYHQHIKPKPAAMAEPTGDGKTRWVCQTCGYVYEGDEMPDDFICPWCKHGKADFIKITE